MKKIATIAIMAVLSLSTASFAQSDKEVTELLDKVIAQFEKGGVEMNGIVHYGDGAFALTLKMDHECFHANVADFALWFDSKTQWFLRSGEIYISSPTPEEQLAFNPYLLMKEIKTLFNVRKIDNKKLPKGTTFGLQITPRNNSELQSAQFFFDKDYRLVSLQSILQNGNRADIDITSFKNDLKYSVSDFTCNPKNYDAEVIDMR